MAFRLIDQLACLSRDLYVVLDDFHLIVSREIHDALLYLLHQPLAKVHLVITSRYAMPFSVSRLKVGNQMVEISCEELRFSNKETSEFFSQVLPLRLSANQIEVLNGHLEGGVGGLRLFGLSLKGKVTIDALSGVLSRTLQEASDYLIEEVINSQPDKIREFLYTTALLERFNAELCREATGSEDAAETLDYVRRNNLFLISLDEEGKWYRYHHIFSKAIRDTIRPTRPDAWTKVYQTAASWFGRKGYLEDAFRHAFAARLPCRAQVQNIGTLTRRETGILELLTAGYRDREIADKFCISLHTVKTHMKHVFQKLDVNTRVQAVRRAEELKLVGNYESVFGRAEAGPHD
jgi:LuxR family maltose regulon positive regulatory protein